MSAGRRIALVGCVRHKLDVAAPGADLYLSPLFRGRRARVERDGLRWFVLSARYGLVEPTQVIEPYDENVGDKDRVARAAWADGIVADLLRREGDLHGLTVELHAGGAYVAELEPRLTSAGVAVEVPTKGLGIGQQLAFYSPIPTQQREHR